VFSVGGGPSERLVPTSACPGKDGDRYHVPTDIHTFVDKNLYICRINSVDFTGHGNGEFYADLKNVSKYVLVTNGTQKNYTKKAQSQIFALITFLNFLGEQFVSKIYFFNQQKILDFLIPNII
jgi:hypothetical protein